MGIVHQILTYVKFPDGMNRGLYTRATACMELPFPTWKKVCSTSAQLLLV